MTIKSMFVIGFTLCCMLACKKEAVEPESQSTSHEKFSPQWISFIDDSKDDAELDISTKYLGIQGWQCIANPPHLYIGATFPTNTFGTSFDKEMANEKYPINLIFHFTKPYITRMDIVKGSEYLYKIKEAIKSEEYSNLPISTRPYIVKLAELKELDNIEFCFAENKEFGKTLKKICKQEWNMTTIKSLLIGKIIFKRFTVSIKIYHLFRHYPVAFFLLNPT